MSAYHSSHQTALAHFCHNIIGIKRGFSGRTEQGIARSQSSFTRGMVAAVTATANKVARMVDRVNSMLKVRSAS